MNPLPSGWTWTSLGEVVNPLRERADPSLTPDLPYIGLEHVESNTMQILRLDRAANYRSSAIRFRPGSVLYARLRPYLNKVVQPGFDGLCSGEFIVFPPTAHLCGDFLRYLLNSAPFVSFASHLKEGDRPRVDFAQIASFPIALPPLPEQQRIVAEIEKQFTRLDHAVSALHSVGRHSRTLRSSLLTRAADIGSNRRPLRELLSEPLANGRSVPTASVGNQSFPVLKLTAVRTGRIDLGQCKSGEWSEDQARPFLVAGGDFLIVRGNGSKSLVGRAGIVGEVSRGIAYPDTLIRARFRQDLVYSPFIAALWDSSVIRRQIEKVARTSAGIYKINQKDLEDLSIAIPDIAAQKELFSCWSAYDSVLAATDRTASLALKRATRLRQSILKKAFSGQLVPQDKNDEPVSVLLERIGADRVPLDRKTAPRKRNRNQLNLIPQT